MNKMILFMRESSTARFLIPLGLMVIIFGVVVLIINIQNQNYIKIQSTVTDTREEQETTTDTDGTLTTTTVYNITVIYTVDGKEYVQDLDDVSKKKVGDKVDIYYNPKNPNQITQTKSLIMPIMMIIAGIGSLAGGINSAIKASKKKMI